jgi:hypothetical protein
MRKIISKIIFLIVSITSIAIAANAEIQSGKPILSIDEPTFKAGEVKEGTVIEHAFKVLNKGDQPLEIIKVKPT